MFNTSVFDYINVLQKTADAAWIRNDVIANNIANATTPGDKRQDIAFEDELTKALRHSRYKSMDAKVADLKMNRLKPFSPYFIDLSKNVYYILFKPDF